MKPKLIIIRGIPGSGKSTKAKTFPFLHLEADMFFYGPDGAYNYDRNLIRHAHEWRQRITCESLANGISVVVSNTFTTKKEVDPYIQMAIRAGAKYEIITMRENYGSIHGVPCEVIERMIERWEEIP